MARRNNNKMTRMPKIEPAEMTLRFSTPNFNGVRTFFIDLSQVASLVNRRFYRQGLNWGVAGFKILSADADTVGAFTVSKLPNSWVMSNAWHKSFATWQKKNNEALEESESVRPRFLDFKVFADGDHHQAGFAANMLPNSRTTTAAPGEWVHSTLQMPNSRLTTPAAGTVTFNEYDLIATGPNYPGVSPVTTNDAVSLIEGYANSRGLPNVLDPNAPDDADDAQGATPENWMAALFNDGIVQDAEILEQMLTENNIAPYPFENDGVNVDTMYPGGQLQLTGLMVHDESLITTTTVGGITRLKGGNFPCGLIRIDCSRTAAESGNYLIQIEMIPGTHRGYMAESMQDM